VVRKESDIVDPLRAERAGCGPANAAGKRDAQAAVRSLIGADDEEPRPGDASAIEACPVVVVERGVKLARDRGERRYPVVFPFEKAAEALADAGVAFLALDRFTSRHEVSYTWSQMRRKSNPHLHSHGKSKAASSKAAPIAATQDRVKAQAAPEPSAQESAKARAKSMMPKSGDVRRNDTIPVQSEWLEAHEEHLVVSIPLHPLAPVVPGLTARGKVAKAPPPLPPHAAPTAVEVRVMRPGDISLVCELNLQLGYSGTAEEIRSRFDEVRKQAEQGLFVGLVGQRLVGWLHVQSRRSLESEAHAEITALIVDHKERRRGVGRALVGRAREWAKEGRHTTLRVRSNINREEAHRFYPALGFRVVKTQHNYSLDLSGT
jgi:ribosomal protein S18 acetylase RimI-like enzyme